MSAIIRDAFKTRTLLNFINRLSVDSLYLGIGRPQSWDTVSNIDATVPVPENTPSFLNRDWEDMLSLKRISFSDSHPGIFKETWQSNVKYDTYRHDWNGSRTSVYNGQNSTPLNPSSLSDVKCFVVTPSTNSIYVCLKQLVVNGVVQPSLYSPESGVAVGVNTGVVKTADGYYWKFLATTAAADIIKFSSKYYHPVSTVQSEPSPLDPYFTQWQQQVYSASFKGGIYTINVTGIGAGYNGGIAGTRAVADAETDAEFKIVGDGTGIQFTVTYGSGGSITDIEVTNPGSGYTHATIRLTGGTGASFDVIYSPMTGLGCDPVNDVVARYLLLDTVLTGAEGSGDFTISNDYRKICLVYNPTNFGTATISTSATLDATTKLNVGTGLSAGVFPVDAIVTGASSGAKGRVVDYDSVTGILRVIRTSSENLDNLGANNSFAASETLQSSPGTGNVAIGSISDSEVKLYSGEIIYSEYRSPITRSELQSEDFKIVVKF